MNYTYDSQTQQMNRIIILKWLMGIQTISNRGDIFRRLIRNYSTGRNVHNYKTQEGYYARELSDYGLLFTCMLPLNEVDDVNFQVVHDDITAIEAGDRVPPEYTNAWFAHNAVKALALGDLVLARHAFEVIITAMSPDQHKRSALQVVQSQMFKIVMSVLRDWQNTEGA